MRWGRVAFEAVILLALFGTSLLLWVESTRSRIPYLPHYVFVHDEKVGSLIVQGTWTLEDEQIAWPSQTTSLECERAARRCLEASAVLASHGDLTSLMPVTINELSILRWDDDLIVVRGPGALCVDEIYNIHLKTQIVTGLTTAKKDHARDVCSTASRESKRMRMIDGFKASRAARWGKGVPGKQ